MKNKPKLASISPSPRSGPGDTPDFSGVTIPDAGTVRRPDIAVEPREISDLAYTLIRVLDDDGTAVGQWNPELDPDTLQARPAADDADARL